MFFTPGVPSEFKVMVEHEILPRLRERFSLPLPPVCLRLTTFGRSESDLAQSLDTLQLPPGVTMGYRSSMPIIELKLTGPASEEQAMEKLWLDVKRVAGQSVIFEGTEGLPAQISRELQSRQFSLTLSEQFTGGLLALNFLAQMLHCWRVKWFLHSRKPWRKLRTGLQNGGRTILLGWHWLFLVWKMSISTLH